MKYNLETWVFVGVGIVVFAGFLYKALAPVKSTLRSVPKDGLDTDEVVGTLDDLAAAEKVVAEGSFFDHQKKIYEKYERLERLHTSAGFTSDHANKIVSALQDQGFDAFMRWQESALPGTYAIMPIGYYEIFVARGQAEEARQFLSTL